MTDGFQPADSARPGLPGGSSHAAETPEATTARSGAARADRTPSTGDAGAHPAVAATDDGDGDGDGPSTGTPRIAGKASITDSQRAVRSADAASADATIVGAGAKAAVDAGVAGSVESGRDVDPEAISRKLLMGLALLLALASVYSGVFNWPKTFQMMLAAAATIALVSALRRPYGEPPRRK